MRSKYFKKSEFCCRCGCGLCTPSQRLVDALDALRELIGLPIIISGPLRCESHNAAIGGVSKSRHMPPNCDGVDIMVRGMTGPALMLYAVQIPAFADGGIGLYPDRLHVDVRGHRARWKKNK